MSTELTPNIEPLLNQAYNQAIDHAIGLAISQIIYPVEGQDGTFINLNTFVTVLEHLKNSHKQLTNVFAQSLPAIALKQVLCPSFFGLIPHLWVHIF